ncbi:MAG: hypothetical protein A3E83_03350 [Gammaproteobacteria bacterium RIFCSPHIGHO2_12_FULL_41_20]|nr:MAG: hypothetical protein A3E83_03350 [Gammaproteobacteria bacterium RIFCSPHIGHO2_12_FULL_41_20]
MVRKLFISLIVLIAIITGILVLTVPRDTLVKIIMFRDFFDVSLPILAFGALIKYLCFCPHHGHHCHDKKHCDSHMDK